MRKIMLALVLATSILAAPVNSRRETNSSAACALVTEQLFWMVVDSNAQALSAFMPLDQAYYAAYEIALQFWSPLWDVCSAS